MAIRDVIAYVFAIAKIDRESDIREWSRQVRE
jgi:hypothetical protein